MTTPSILRAQQAIAGLPNVDEVEQIARFACEQLTKRYTDTRPGSDVIGFKLMRLIRHTPPPPDWGDADELETRNTLPAPPPESER